MSVYNLSFGDDIVIYGAGQIGKQFYERVKENFNVIAFFDNNAEKISPIGNIPVFSFFESTGLEDKTVIICLHNALFHIEVAEKLNKHGFKKIIFIPAETQSYNPPAKSKMEQIYTAIFANELFHSDIPEYIDLTQIACCEAVIGKYNTNVVTVVDVALLYVGSEKQPDQIKKRNSSHCSENYKVAYDMFMSYANKPIIALMPYIKFFNSMLFGCSDIDDYFCMCKAIQNKEHVTDEEFIKDRYQVYALLEQKFAQGIQRFNNSPVKVEWNSRGFFETIDGFHRAVFLFCKGQKFIPVIMSNDDYEKWSNASSAKQVITLFEKNAIKRFVTPLPSPYFRHTPYKREFPNRNLIVQIMQFLDTKPLGNLSFIDLSDYNAYFARHFYRMGVQNSATIETVRENQKIVQMINCMLSTSEVECIYVPERYSFEGIYDIAIITESLTTLNQKSILQKINDNITQLIFWEFDPESDTVEIVINISRFKYYRKLGNIFNEGQYHEFGVFFTSIDPTQ